MKLMLNSKGLFKVYISNCVWCEKYFFYYNFQCMLMFCLFYSDKRFKSEIFLGLVRTVSNHPSSSDSLLNFKLPSITCLLLNMSLIIWNHSLSPKYRSFTRLISYFGYFCLYFTKWRSHSSLFFRKTDRGQN